MYEFRSSIGEKGMGFRLCDTMGLEEDNSLDSINFPYLLDGNVKDRYQVGDLHSATSGVALKYCTRINILEASSSV